METDNECGADQSDKCFSQFGQIKADMERAKNDIQTLFRELKDSNVAVMIKLDRANATLQGMREEWAEARGMLRGSRMTIAAIAGSISMIVGPIAAYIAKKMGLL